MPLLSWKPEYSVHNAELDSHHLQLFSLFNNVYENIMNSLEVRSVLPLIDKLTEYTEHHFAAEEEHMKVTCYQEIEEHISMHREFTQKVVTLKEHFHGNNLDVSRELLILLGEWLLQHVIKEDKKYSLS